MNKKLKKHLVYWILPSLFVGLCMLIYFFDFLGLSFIIAPEYNREFGVIENTQLAIICAIGYTSYKSLVQVNSKSMKFAFAIFLLGSIFIFLEEIDYGLHFYDYLSGKTVEEINLDKSRNEIRNIHNYTNLTDPMKLFAYIFFGAIIVVYPFLVKRLNITDKFLKLLVPQHYLIYTLLAMAALNQIALYIDHTMKNNAITSLNYNISEFEEVFIYYIIFLYLIEIKNKLFPVIPHTNNT